MFGWMVMAMVRATGVPADLVALDSISRATCAKRVVSPQFLRRRARQLASVPLRTAGSGGQDEPVRERPFGAQRPSSRRALDEKSGEAPLALTLQRGKVMEP